MNNQDYEQKRRECWDEYCKTHPMCNTPVMRLNFDWTFDRAYALGKQEKDADTVIQGWILVDEKTFQRIVRVHKITQGYYEAVWDSGEPEFYLEEEVFPDMTPNDRPEPVEIIIKRKKK